MKKVALIAFGIADGYCHTESQRLINNGPELFNKVHSILKDSGSVLGAYVSVNNPADTFRYINFNNIVPQTKIINFKLCSNEFLHLNNEISLTDYSNDTMLFDGNQLDFILPPKDYDIHICGIDINGVFINAINSLIKLGYSVTVYSDAIKPFSKRTILHIKDSDVKFVSAKSVSLK